MTWQLGSALVLTAALALGFAWYERSRPPARVLALVAALAALAAIGRVAFAAFPNVKPTSDMVLFAGYTLGGPAGFAVGALAALVSNVFLGQGPWTPWQMAAWGVVGLGGALVGRLLRRREPGRVFLAGVCGVAGFVFGGLMDLYQWTLAAEHTPASYLAISGTSLGFNIAHAVGNVAFALVLGPAFIRALTRYRRRFEARWLTAPPRVAGVAGVLLLALVLTGGGSRPAIAAASADVAPAVSRAVHYLRFSQNADGGFGPARKQSSTQLHTGWAALGLAATGRNPLDIKRSGHSIIGYVDAHAGSLSDIGEIERTMLVLRAAGLPQRMGNVNLLARLLAKQRRDGSFGTVNHTAFGVLALRAAGRGTRSHSVRAATRWLLRSAARDDGFGFARNAASDVDDTGAVLQAIAAGGRRGSPVVARAVSYLRKAEHADGGFGQMAAADSNAQSTAFAIQGLVAVGRNPSKLRRTRSPIEYLVSLQASDGSVRYSRTSTQTPVWVTAQALDALEEKPFPLRPAPRRRARAVSHAARAKAAASPTPKPAARPVAHVAVRHVQRTYRPRHHAPASAPPTVNVQPAANTSSTSAPAKTDPPAQKSSGGFSWPYVFAALIGLVMLAGIRLAWRRA